jgi:hypothetical protein
LKKHSENTPIFEIQTDIKQTLIDDKMFSFISFNNNTSILKPILISINCVRDLSEVVYNLSTVYLY